MSTSAKTTKRVTKKTEEPVAAPVPVVEAKKTETKTVSKKVETTKKEEEMATETATPKRVVESVTKEMFFSEIEKLRAEIAELKLSKTEVVEAVELSNDNIEVLSHNPEAKSEVKMNLYSKKRQATTFDVVLNKLNK
jgi:hypothetical protein